MAGGTLVAAFVLSNAFYASNSPVLPMWAVFALIGYCWLATKEDKIPDTEWQSKPGALDKIRTNKDGNIEHLTPNGDRYVTQKENVFGPGYIALVFMALFLLWCVWDRNH